MNGNCQDDIDKDKENWQDGSVLGEICLSACPSQGCALSVRLDTGLKELPMYFQINIKETFAADINHQSAES